MALMFTVYGSMFNVDGLMFTVDGSMFTVDFSMFSTVSTYVHGAWHYCSLLMASMSTGLCYFHIQHRLYILHTFLEIKYFRNKHSSCMTLFNTQNVPANFSAI